MNPPRYEITDTELGQVDSVCVFCWGLLGDVFVRVSAIEALKKRFPNARITVVVDPVGKQVFENHPSVDTIFVYDRRKNPILRYLFRSIRNILYLRARKFDLSINLYSGGASPRIVRLVNARVRLGFDHTEALRASNNLLVKHADFSKQWNLGFGSVLQPLGVKPSQIRAGTSYYCTSYAMSYADKFFMDRPEQYIAYNLGAGKISKCWPIERFVSLARHIAKHYKLHPLIISNPGMSELAEKFTSQYKDGEPIIKMPVLELDKLAAIMSHCQYVITGDTSIMHLAFGLKIPTLVLLTQTRPEPVMPEDCLHTYCFKPDPSERDQFGQPAGSPNIPVEMAIRKFEDLVQIRHKSDSASS